jgi:hypothetical protein
MKVLVVKMEKWDGLERYLGIKTDCSGCGGGGEGSFWVGSQLWFE